MCSRCFLQHRHDKIFTIRPPRRKRSCGMGEPPLCWPHGRTRRRFSMLNRTGLTLVCAALVAGTATAVSPPPAAAAGVVLTPHRAIYDLRLLRTRGKKDIEGVRGRILYDFSGSACAGYVLNFRQVSELASGENKTALSDLRATTWEEGTAKRFKFSSENLLDDKTVDKVDGEAERDSDHVAVKLAKPKDKAFDLDHAMVFPTEHMRRIIEA